jgi:hypothetical protein
METNQQISDGYICISSAPPDGYGFIYTATSPSGKVYVGKTTKSVLCRKKQHFWKAFSGLDTKFCRAIRRYSKDMVWRGCQTQLVC